MLDWFEANPKVQLPNRIDNFGLWFFGDKQPFLETVKTFGSCEKKFEGRELLVTKRFGALKLVASINREKVCTLKRVVKEIQVDEWECLPLLTEEEFKEAGNVTTA